MESCDGVLGSVAKMEVCWKYVCFHVMAKIAPTKFASKIYRGLVWSSQLVLVLYLILRNNRMVVMRQVKSEKKEVVLFDKILEMGE